MSCATLMRESGVAESATSAQALQAHFYRFLDTNGVVIPPPTADEAGQLISAEEAQLNLSRLPEEEQIGYLSRAAEDSRDSIDEVLTMPIRSTDNGELIAGLVAGFQPIELQRAGAGMLGGIWLKHRLHLAAVSSEAQDKLAREIGRAVNHSPQQQGSFSTAATGISYLLFYKQFNPGSFFPPAYEVCFIRSQNSSRANTVYAGASPARAGCCWSVDWSRVSSPRRVCRNQSKSWRFDRK